MKYSYRVVTADECERKLMNLRRNRVISGYSIQRNQKLVNLFMRGLVKDPDPYEPLAPRTLVLYMNMKRNMMRQINQD